MKIKREWTTTVTAGAFLITAVTGILMFFHSETGLNKTAHEWLSWIFLFGATLHLAINFTAFKKYLTQRSGQLLLGVCVLLLALSFVPIGKAHHESPFEPPLKVLAQTPLTILAQVAKKSPEQLIVRLTGEGFTVSSDQQSISELVGDDFRTQVYLLKTLLAVEH